MAEVAAAPLACSHRQRPQRLQYGLLALLVAAAACLSPTAHAQNMTTYTVRLAGAGGNDLARGVGLDGGGSAFVVGSFQSPVFSVGQRADLTNARPEPALDGSRSSDAFVAKLTRFGQLAWAVSMGGWGDDAAAAVAVEPGSNAPAYVVGSFDSAELVLHAPGGAPAQALIKAPDEKTWTGLANALVAKVDTKGAVTWALQLGGADGNEAATAVAVDAAVGRVYVAGTFASAALPVGGATTLRNTGGAADGFVAAFSTSDGSVQWAVGLQGAGTDSPTGLAVDAATGSVYVTGVSDSAALAFAFGGQGAEPLALGDEGAPTVFVARLQGATGAVEWARAIGALTTAVVDPEMAVAAGGETVLVLLGQQPPLPAVLALEGRTGEPRWSAAVAGAQRLAVDAAGAAAYLAGVFEEPLTLGGTNMAATAKQGGDLYLARLDARTGRLEAGSSFGGGDSAEKGLADLELDGTGSVYMAGSYADGGLGFSTTLQPAALAGGTDSFFARVAMGAATQPRAPTRRPTYAPTTASAAAMTTWSTLSEDSKATTGMAAAVTTTAEPMAAVAAANDEEAIGSSTESSGHVNLIALFSYAGTMETVPYLQDAVFLLLHDFSSFMAYLTPGIRDNDAGTRGRKLRRHRALTDAVATTTTSTTPCADPKTPRIDVPFFVDPADTRAAGDIQNLLDGVRGGEIPLRYAGIDFGPAVLCDVLYGPTTLDASFFIPPPLAPADDDCQRDEGDITTIDGAMIEGGEAAAAAKEVMDNAHSFFGNRMYLVVAIGAGGGGATLLFLLGWWLWKRWGGEQFVSPKRLRMSNTVLPGAAATARVGGAPPTPGSADGVSVLTEEGTAHTAAHRRAGSYGPLHSQAAPPLQMPAAAIDASQQPVGASAAIEAASIASEQGLQSLAGGGGSSRLLVARPARASSRSTPPPVFVPSLAGGPRDPEQGAGEQQQQELPTPSPVREDAAAAAPAPPRSPLLTAVASLFSKPPSPLRAPAAVGAQAQQSSPTKTAATAGPSPGTVKRREEEAERVRQAEAERERERAEQEAMERQMMEAAALRRKQEEEAEAATKAVVEAVRVKAEKETAMAAKEKACKEREAAEAMKKKQQQEAAEVAARLKAEKEAEERARKEREALRRKQEEEARIKALKEAEEARLKKEREMAEALRKKKEAEEAARVQAQKEAEERQLQYQREREEKEKRLQELLRLEQEERRQRRDKEKQQRAALAKQLQHPPSSSKAQHQQQPASKHAPSPGGLDDLIGPVAAWDLGATGAADHDAAAAEAEAARVRALIRPEVLAEMQAYAALPSASASPPRAGPPRPAPLPLESHASPSPPPASQQVQPGSRGFLPSYLMPTSSSSTKQRGPGSK